MKKINFLSVVIIIFAVFAIFGGVYAFYRTAEYAFSKTNGGKIVMAQELTGNELTDYEQLKQELDEKYLGMFCDIFAEAKSELLSKTEDILGDEYKALKQQSEDAREELKKLAEGMGETAELVALKDKLTDLKEKLIHAPTEDEKNAIKAEMKQVLSEITRINLANFSALSLKKKAVDEINAKIRVVVEDKKDDVKEVETEILTAAREKMKGLVFSYATEAEALAKAFGLTDYKKEPYFLSLINPEARLIDFDKQAMLDAVHGRHSHHGHDHGRHEAPADCDHDCSCCTHKCDDDETDDSASVFYSDKVDKNDN